MKNYPVCNELRRTDKNQLSSNILLFWQTAIVMICEIAHFLKIGITACFNIEIERKFYFLWSWFHIHIRGMSYIVLGMSYRYSHSNTSRISTMEA